MASVSDRKPIPLPFKSSRMLTRCGSDKAIQFPDYKYITGVAGMQAPVKLGTLADSAANLVSVDRFAPSPFQSLNLQSGILVISGQARVANFHDSIMIRHYGTRKPLTV